MTYAAILKSEEDGQISAFIPDLPDVFATGDSADDAFERLTVAAEEYAAYLKAEGLPAPPARTMHSIRFVEIAGAA